MFLSEVLEILQDEGLPATAAKIRHGILTGRIARPPRNAIGFCIYSDPHLVEIREYLRHPPRRGRTPRRGLVTA